MQATARGCVPLFALLALAAGCRHVELVEPGSGGFRGPVEIVEPDEHEPDDGGRFMTAMKADRQYFKTIWPADDVDFGYLETSGTTGEHTVRFQIADNESARIRIWTRARPTSGRSTLVEERVVTDEEPVFFRVLTTPENPCIAIRVEGTGAGSVQYLLHARRFGPPVE